MIPSFLFPISGSIFNEPAGVLLRAERTVDGLLTTKDYYGKLIIS